MVANDKREQRGSCGYKEYHEGPCSVLDCGSAHKVHM